MFINKHIMSNTHIRTIKHTHTHDTRSENKILGRYTCSAEVRVSQVNHIAQD